MTYAVAILNCMAHGSLYWRTPHDVACGFTPDVAHLTKFVFWELVLLLDKKTQFPKSARFLATMLDLPLIRVLYNDTEIGPMRMVYLPVISYNMTIELRILITVRYQTMGGQICNPILNPSTLNPSTLF